MKRVFPLVLSLLASALTSWSAPDTAAGDEDQQVAILQSEHSLAEKDAACARLKWIGTARCVPALAALLTDEQLSHSARYALESMPGPEAEAALLQALAKTSGSNQIGVINSLAVGQDTVAVPALGKLLSGANTNVACAAAMALGRIGERQAIDALQGAWPHSLSGALRDAEFDGLMACANKLLTEGDRTAALKIFQSLSRFSKTEGARQAIFRGVILASDRGGISLMVQAIVGHDPAEQGAALQVAAQMEGSDATKALADLLPKVQVPVQIALLDCLDRRGDPSALQAVAKMADSSDPDVRLAAINALGDLGDGSVAVLLAGKAATAAGQEKIAARQALVNLRRGEVTLTLLKAFTTASAAVKPELIRALGDRGDASAVPRLLEMARSQDEGMRASALQALALLAGPAQLPDLVQLAVQATTDDARSEAADALGSTCQRIEARSGHCDVQALVEAVRNGPLPARLALLPVCSGLAEAPVREALRDALQDSEARVREAARRDVCDTRDGELMPDLLQLASSGGGKTRLLAIRGCVRLATQEEGVKLSNDQKLAAFKTILDKPLEAPEKRLVLSGLTPIPDRQALELAAAMLDDQAVRAEAAQSVIAIAGSLAATQPDAARSALTKVLDVVNDPVIQVTAMEARKKIWKMSGFVTQWQVAGPYQQKGKNYSELFDIPFAPETGESASVHWQDLAASANATEPWNMDLLQALGGEQRVAYARTWIHSATQQNVRMEIGSDDGVKVWLNDRIVHANNVARALEPGSDGVDVTLKGGWNTLLLKVTQFNQGWGFCVRFAQASGEPVARLRISSNPDTAGR
ncbi:MAG TPA: HEAT repeat domain-containing protein [Verrucomicrobiae bacterium]|nr:HEAT repeat domain-containing protein [Verrucomicrobiae bacterium]